MKPSGENDLGTKLMLDIHLRDRHPAIAVVHLEQILAEIWGSVIMRENIALEIYNYLLERFKEIPEEDQPQLHHILMRAYPRGSYRERVHESMSPKEALKEIRTLMLKEIAAALGTEVNEENKAIFEFLCTTPFFPEEEDGAPLLSSERNMVLQVIRERVSRPDFTPTVIAMWIKEYAFPDHLRPEIVMWWIKSGAWRFVLEKIRDGEFDTNSVGPGFRVTD